MIISKGKKKKILKLLREKYGIEKFPYLLIQSGKEKLRIFSGSLGRQELYELTRTVRIESVGLYFAFFKEVFKEDIRLSIDACHVLQIKKNIFEINKKEEEKWMRGEDIEIKEKERLKDFVGFVVIKHENDYLGSGKIANSKILNFVPKERRTKKTQNEQNKACMYGMQKRI